MILQPRLFLRNCQIIPNPSIETGVRAVTRALIGGGGGEEFIYSRSAPRISFEISCH